MFPAARTVRGGPGGCWRTAHAVLCAILAGVLLVPLAQTPAFAGEDTRNSRFGIDYVFWYHAYGRDETFAKVLAETGAKWVNFADVSWAATTGKDGAYDWTLLDSAVALYQKYGFHIVFSLRIGDVPCKGEVDPEVQAKFPNIDFKKQDRLPSDEGAYRAWVQALVERYDHDLCQDADGLSDAVLHFQVGNEYGNIAYWVGTLESYGTLLDWTREAAQAACPEAKIISNGLRWNDLFHRDPNASRWQSTYDDLMKRLEEPWSWGWDRVKDMNEVTVSFAGKYAILDLGGNGPFHLSTAGYVTWVKNAWTLAGVTAEVWDMEARCEPRVDVNENCYFHPELQVPGGDRILAALKKTQDPLHAAATTWYREEQARILVKVLVGRFAAGCERVFMGMAQDWNEIALTFLFPNRYIGILDADANPWPAAKAMRFLADHIDHFSTVEQVAGQESGVKLYRFRFQDHDIWVAWLDEADSALRGYQEPTGTFDTLPSKWVTLRGVSGPASLYTVSVTGAAPAETKLPAGAGARVRLTPTPILIDNSTE